MACSCRAGGACRAACSGHLPLKGGEPALGLDPRVDRPGSSPGQAPRREGVANPPPSLPLSRGGRRLRPAPSQMPNPPEEAEETADPPPPFRRAPPFRPAATESTPPSPPPP